MGPSKIQLKVQHKNHEKQTKESKAESIQKQKSQKKEQKSGAQLGKSKSKEKMKQKSIAQQSSLKDQKIQKSKSKDKNESKLKQKSSEKKDRKADKKKKGQRDKKKQKQKNKNELKDNEEGKKVKADKKTDKKEKKSKKDKKGKGDSEQQDEKSIVKSRSKRELNKQFETINSINKQTAKAKLTIGELIELYKDASYEIFVNHGHNPKKQKEIEQELLRLQRQKEKRRKKLEQLDKAAEQRKRQREIQLEESEKKKKQKIIEKRKRAISLRLQKLSSEAKKRKQQHMRFEQYVQSHREQQPRYKKYQKPFLQFEQSLKQQQQQILQQRKLKASPTDYQQLQRFRQSYEQQRMQALQHSQKKMELQQRLIEQENQWLGKLYKGSVYVEMEKQGKRNVLVEEHQTAKQKLQRTKEYGKMVKSQFIIMKDDNNKDEQYEQGQSSRINYDSQDVRYREKHILGKSLGLVPQKRVKPLTHEQKVKMGVSYLQQLRRLPRKGLKSTGDPTAHTIQTPLLSNSSRMNGGTYIMKKPTNPFYSQFRGGTSFDAKNKRQIELTLEQVKSKDQSTALQEKALKYMQYAGVNQLQKKYSDVNRRLVGDISGKLDILKKLVE